MYIPTMQLNEIKLPPGTPLIPTLFSGSLLPPVAPWGGGRGEMKELGKAVALIVSYRELQSFTEIQPRPDGLLLPFS